jgi:pre-mRNA 3'-end-processing factor FIP1
LAAYGIDPSTAVVEQTPEDGLVEEEDMEDESDSDDDDDVKLVLTGPGNRMDLR